MRPPGSGGVPASAALLLLDNVPHCLRRGALHLPARRSERCPCYYSDRLLVTMIDHLNGFLEFLALNQNASAHTVRAYQSDLTQLLLHVAGERGVAVEDITPAALDRTAVRSFLAAVYAARHTRATAARKLAAVRAFVRYLRHQSVIDSDPGLLVATPKRDVRVPAHLSEPEATAVVDAPAVET